MTDQLSTLASGSTGRDSFWMRIAAEISAAIAAGVYPPGQRLPTEHALAEHFGVNRHTIRRSLADLCSRGLVRVAQGSGTFVEEFAVELLLSKRTRHSQSLGRSGLRGRIELLDVAPVRAQSNVARALEIRPRNRVLRLRTIGDAEGRPLHFSERWFPLPRFDGIDSFVAESGSITDALARLGVADYTRRESHISARMPSEEIAARLRQARSRPALFVESVNVDTDQAPVEYAHTWFAGDRVTLAIENPT